MPTIEREKILIPTSFSVAMLAMTGNLADHLTSQLLMVRDKHKGTLGPVAGKLNLIDEKLEHPYEALEREWNEETGGLPFKFVRKPIFTDTLYVNQMSKISIGFIYSAFLTDDVANSLRTPKPVVGDEDIDQVELCNCYRLEEILKNWQTMLTHPEINGQTVLNWLNKVDRNHDEISFSGVISTYPKLSDYGMNFNVTSLGISEK